MGHYPIKCIRCASVMSNEEVLFHTGNVITSMVDQLKGTKAPPKSSFESRAAATKKSLWDDDEEPAEKTKEKPQGLKEKMTLQELLAYAQSQQDGTFQPHYQHVDVTPDFLDEEGTEEDEDLLVGISFQPQEGGPTARAWDRYCPHCLMQLPKRSGQMPTYNVTLIGTSSSGKTVYLCALNRILSTAQAVLPYRSVLSCVCGNSASNAIVSATTDLFVKGVLPNTTQNLLNEPLVFELTYRVGEYQKECLLALTDMRGEDMVQEGGANLMTRAQFLANADGFLFIVSPLNMNAVLARLPQEVGRAERQNPTVHQQLTKQISDYLLTFFENGKIDKPCVTMLSKSDYLRKYFQNLGLPPYHPVIAKEPDFRYTKTYFGSQMQGARQFLNYYDAHLGAFIHNNFLNNQYTSFSSLGAYAVIREQGEQKFIQNVNALYPSRVVDPMILLLMKLNFLPQFCQMEAGTQYVKGNDQLMMDWKENCL